MLKIGIKFEEVIVIQVDDKIIKLKAEKRNGQSLAVVFDAPKEAVILRERFVPGLETEFKEKK